MLIDPKPKKFLRRKRYRVLSRFHRRPLACHASPCKHMALQPNAVLSVRGAGGGSLDSPARAKQKSRKAEKQRNRKAEKSKGREIKSTKNKKGVQKLERRKAKRQSEKKQRSDRSGKVEESRRSPQVHKDHALMPFLVLSCCSRINSRLRKHDDARDQFRLESVLLSGRLHDPLHLCLRSFQIEPRLRQMSAQDSLHL